MAVEGQITVRCSCGKKLKAPAGSAGKKARCPACGIVLRLIPSEPGTAALGNSSVSAPPLGTSAGVARTTLVAAAGGSGRAGAVAGARTAVIAPPPARAKPPADDFSDPDDDGGLGALYELSEQANTAVVAPDVPVCPSCRSAMENRAVLCTNCGYDTRSGKSLSTKKEAPVLGYATPKGKSKGAVDRMAPQGSFILGLVLAGVFGIVCGILWIVVMFVTGYEVGLLATVVGWTVGLGMQIGQKGYSRRGGIAAATIAVLAIAGPKLLIMALLLAVTHGKNAGEIGYAFFHPLTILFIVLGIGAAYRTANGAS